MENTIESTVTIRIEKLCRLVALYAEALTALVPLLTQHSVPTAMAMRSPREARHAEIPPLRLVASQ